MSVSNFVIEDNNSDTYFLYKHRTFASIPLKELIIVVIVEAVMLKFHEAD